MTSLPARFWTKVQKTETCWLWTAKTTNDGYGQFYWLGKMRYAHRLSYEDAHGPIPAGLDIDHVKARGCTSTSCVNPSHLEAVTHRENLRRGRGIGGSAHGGAHNLAKTHCPQGHAYDEVNTYRMKNGGRACKECGRAADRRAYHQRNPDAKRRGPYNRKAAA